MIKSKDIWIIWDLNASFLFKFNNDGYLILENFLSLDDCNELRKECDNIIESHHFVEEAKTLPLFKLQVRTLI